MRADKDDIPDYLRTRKKRSPWRFLGIIGIGSAIFWMLALFIGKPIVIDIKQLKSAIRIADKPLFEPAPAQPGTGETPKQIPRPAFQPQSAPQLAPRQTERQIVFNDSNYTPRGAVNSMAPPPAVYRTSNQPPERHKVSHTLSSRWQWENGHKKQMTGGKFEWVDHNGAIDWSTVCQNYERGSIEYRDCRKGAKAKFKQLCGTYKPACRAENGFMP